MAATAQELLIRIAADTKQANEALRTISTQFKQVGDSGAQAADSTDRLKNKVAAMGHAGGALYLLTQAFQAVGASISGAVKAADGWAVVSAKMRIASGDATNFAEIQGKVFEIAQKAGARFEDIGDVYAKVAKGAETLGLSQERVIGVTETIANTLRMMGGSSASASAALTQFGQALASGQLRGEELNSVMEQMPPLAEAIAKGMGKTTGELRKLAQDGKLSVNQLVIALEHSALEVERQAAQMPRTFSGSMAVLGNETQKFVARMNEVIGASSLFQVAVETLTKNIGGIAVVLSGVLAAAISKAVAGLYAKAAASLAAAAASRAQAIAEAQLAVQAAATRLSIVGNTAALVAAQASLAKLTGAAATARVAMSALGGPIGIVTGLLTAGATAWMVWGDNAKSAAENAKEAADDNTQNVKRILEEQRKGARYGIGNEGILRQEIERLQKSVSDKEALLARGIAERSKTGGDTSFVNLRTRLAADRAALAEANAGLKIELDKKKEFDAQMKAALPDVVVKGKAPEWTDVFNGQEYDKAQRAAYKSLGGFSFITADKDTATFIREQYAASNAMQSEMLEEARTKDAETRAAWHADVQKFWEGIVASERGDDVQSAMESANQRLASIRQRLDAEVTIGTKGQVAAQIELREETGKLGNTLAGSLIPRLQALIANAPDEATREKWRAFYAEIQGMQATGQQVGPFAGLAKGLEEYANQTSDTFGKVKDAVTGAFKGMEDALVEFAMTGKMSFSNMANSIIADMIRMSIQQSITQPLAKAMSGVNWGSMFSSFFANANGGVYASPGLSAYSGQIVNQPTVFPFANGIGLMGEAGPEAILPLKRGSNGKLGVEGGGANVTVNVVNNASGTQATARERTEGGNRIIDVMIEQVKGAIAGDIARGAGPIPGALSSTYGLNRVAGAY
jgi:lambda family phage tail tape measure protein